MLGNRRKSPLRSLSPDSKASPSNSRKKTHQFRSDVSTAKNKTATMTSNRRRSNSIQREPPNLSTKPRTSNQPSHSRESADKIKLTPSKLTKRFSVTQNVSAKGPKIIRRDIDDPHNILVRRRLGEGTKPLFHRNENSHKLTPDGRVNSYTMSPSTSRPGTSRSRNNNRDRSISPHQYRSQVPKRARSKRRSSSRSSATASSTSRSSSSASESTSSSSAHKRVRSHKHDTVGRRKMSAHKNKKDKAEKKIPYYIDEKREEERLMRRRELRERNRRDLELRKHRSRSPASTSRDRYRRRSRTPERVHPPYSGYMPPHSVVYCPAPPTQPMTVQYIPSPYMNMEPSWLGPGHRPPMLPHPPHHGPPAMPFHLPMPYHFRPNFGPPRPPMPPPYMPQPYRNNMRPPRFPRNK